MVNGFKKAVGIEAVEQARESCLSDNDIEQERLSLAEVNEDPSNSCSEDED